MTASTDARTAAGTAPRIAVRSATEQDLQLILELIKDLAVYEKLGDSVVSSPEAIAQALFSDKPSAEVVIGELDGEAVGFALFFHNYSTFLGRKGLYLEDLFVKPSARGRGLGKLLLIRPPRDRIAALGIPLANRDG